ncbi:MAG TPA: hypothetical protein VFA98_11590 [Thermoanaerobaculia bacterium]|nr:hypothetical protein [Thermoanaerobaculia bacterium]
MKRPWRARLFCFLGLHSACRVRNDWENCNHMFYCSDCGREWGAGNP